MFTLRSKYHWHYTQGKSIDYVIRLFITLSEFTLTGLETCVYLIPCGQVIVTISAAPAQEASSDHFNLQQYYKSEFLFVIDAKRCGNLGRFLNHSCDPNVFVQNVLVDTHDLRFPWVSFFASKTIRAGDELCWDYNYTIGSTPIECKCGTKLCRKRLR